MVVTHTRPKRKQTGARYVDYRKRRKYEMGDVPTLTGLGKNKSKNVRSVGANIKTRQLKVNTANVFDSKQKKYIKAKIKTIIDNPANRHFVRRNIITKGTVLDTDAGKARVTSRPGQQGTVNAVLI